METPRGPCSQLLLAPNGGSDGNCAVPGVRSAGPIVLSTWLRSGRSGRAGGSPGRTPLAGAQGKDQLPSAPSGPSSLKAALREGGSGGSRQNLAREGRGGRDSPLGKPLTETEAGLKHTGMTLAGPRASPSWRWRGVPDLHPQDRAPGETQVTEREAQRVPKCERGAGGGRAGAGSRAPASLPSLQA